MKIPTLSISYHFNIIYNKANSSGYQHMWSQREEEYNEILIFIVDESYGNEEKYIDTSKYPSEESRVFAASQLYKKALSDEFHNEFEDANVGPGADLPAFVTAVSDNIFPLIPWLMVIFFSGKPIVDNIAAWTNIYEKMKQYFTRPVILNRNGAAVVALRDLFEEMDGTPKNIRLLSYRSGYLYDEAEPSIEHLGQIDDAPPSLNLSMVRHEFGIEADGSTFLVVVNGVKSKIKKL